MNARRRVAVISSLVLGLTCLPFAVRLYANLRSQLEEMLPRTAPSIVGLDALHARLGETMQFNILVSGAPLDSMHRLLDRLAEESWKLPNPPRFVDHRTGEVHDFFEPRKALFIEIEDLREIEKRVAARIAYEKRKASPFNLHLDDDEPPPDLDGFFQKYQGKVGDLIDYPSGFYDSQDGKSAAIIFYPAAEGTSIEGATAFRDGIDGLARRLAGEMGLTQLKLEYSGDVQQLIEEQESLKADLLLSSVLVLVFETLLLLGFFRWWPSAIVLGFPLAIGTVATFALGWFFIGSLNASSAFLGSIIVGNGINSGIILLSRFVEERRRGVASESAMRIAVRGTVAATLVASAASAIAYAALMLSTFRGYSHFGFLGAIGMVLCWVANFLLIPGLALSLEKRWPLAHLTQRHWIDRFFFLLGRFNLRRAGTVTLVAAVVSLGCLLAVLRVAADPIENDTKKLRSSWASKPGGYDEVGDRIDAILRRVQTPAVVLAKRDADVRSLEQSYREVIKRDPHPETIELHPPRHLLGTVFTAHTLVPDGQAEKLAILERIRKQLSPARMAELDAKTQDLARKWLPPAGRGPFGFADLPETIRRQFREKDGSEGMLVLLYPKHGTDNSNAKTVRQLAREIRAVPLPAGAMAAGSYLVFADMIESILHDGPVATLVAFIGVFVLSLLLARGARGGIVVTASLLLGVLWTCGLGAAVGMRINFLNFIALPITFGIGVDYAANVYGRYRLGRPGRANLIQSIEFSGAAVAVASATTVIGYSALLFSRNGALFSFGVLAVIGELACLLSALVLLPVMVLRSDVAKRDR